MTNFTNGLEPIKTILGHPFNAAEIEMEINSSEAVNLYLHDAVRSLRDSNLEGIEKCTRVAPGEFIRGIVVGFKPVHERENRLHHIASETSIVRICEHPFLELRAVINAAILSTDINRYIDIDSGTGSAITGYSQVRLDYATISDDIRDNSGQFKITKILEVINTEEEQYSIVECIIAMHERLADAASAENYFDRQLISGTNYKLVPHKATDILAYNSHPSLTSGSTELVDVKFVEDLTKSVSIGGDLLIASDFSTNPWKRGISFTSTTAINNAPKKYHADMWMTLAECTSSANITCGNSFSSQLDMETHSGSATAHAAGGASIAEGWLDLSHNDKRYVTYSAIGNADAGQVGQIAFTYLGAYEGDPNETQIPFLISNGVGSIHNLIMLNHTPSRHLWLIIHDQNGNEIIGADLGLWYNSPYYHPNGQKFIISWNLTEGNTFLTIDGVLQGTVQTAKGTRSTAATLLVFGNDYLLLGNSQFKIKDFAFTNLASINTNVINISRGINTSGQQSTMKQTIVTPNKKFGITQIIRSGLTIDQSTQTKISAGARIFGNGITKVNLAILCCPKRSDPIFNDSLDDMRFPIGDYNWGEIGVNPFLETNWQYVASQQFTISATDFSDIKLENVDMSAYASVPGNWALFIWWDDTTQLTAGKTVEYRYAKLNWGEKVAPFNSENADLVKMQCKQYYDNSYPFGVMPGTASTASGEMHAITPSTGGFLITLSCLQPNYDVWGATSSHVYSSNYPKFHTYSPISGTIDTVRVIDAAHISPGADLPVTYNNTTNKTTEINYAAGNNVFTLEWAHWSVEANLGV